MSAYIYFFLILNLFRTKEIKTLIINDKMNDIGNYNIIYNKENCETTKLVIDRIIEIFKYSSGSKYLKTYNYLKENRGEGLLKRLDLINFISRKCNIDAINLMITNLLLELDSGTLCTSIIYKNKWNEIYLLSNLDWDFWDILMISKFKLIVVNNLGEIKYEALAFFGSVGFVRVQTSKWSLAYNITNSATNKFESGGYIGVLEMISEAADKNLDFDETINFFKNSRNNIGGYYNIISKDKGCILSKSVKYPSKLECINEHTNFLVQKNDPRNYLSQSRKYAENEMENVKNYLDIFEILTSNTIFSRETNFTTISTVSKYFRYRIHIWEENVLGNL